MTIHRVAMFKVKDTTSTIPAMLSKVQVMSSKAVRVVLHSFPSPIPVYTPRTPNPTSSPFPLARQAQTPAPKAIISS